MTEKLEVAEAGTLLPFLRSTLEGWRVKTLKERLQRGCVTVNGDRVTRHDHPVAVGDRVEVHGREVGLAPLERHRSFQTLHVDEHLVAIHKPAGLLSVASDRERARTALNLVREALSTTRHLAPLWPVHRLDRETSGVLLFARSREVRSAVQADWSLVRKSYLAIVEGYPTPPEGTIDRPLWEDDNLNVRVGRRPGARDAVTHYRVQERGPSRALLEVELETGRRHQIRAHLAWLGHPVVGDRRYGTKGSVLGLHAHRLELVHPVGGEHLELVAKPPRSFSQLLSEGL